MIQLIICAFKVILAWMQVPPIALKVNLQLEFNAL